MGSSRACLSLTLGFASALLAGCGPPALSAAPSWQPQNNARAALADRAQSWMAPDAAEIDLLYVSDVGSNAVYAYSYPGGALKGTLKGFARPSGLCVDKAGDVFVTDLTAFRIFEYRHGGANPIAKLKDPGYEPGDCSVDPTTGNLAVTNVSKPYTGAGNLLIYPKAKGPPKRYRDPAIVYYQFCSYDDNGDLFLDGMNAGKFEFAKLPAGASSFTDITLNESFSYAGAVQWNGGAVAVGDYEQNVIYRFSISGRDGTEIGVTHLKGADFPIGFWLQGSRVIAPNDDGANVMFWNYPAGGSHTKLIRGLHYPWGATVSLAPNP
jgi:NHL repeat